MNNSTVLNVYVFLFLLSFSTSILFGQEGTLNTNFDTDGKAITNFVSSADDDGTGVCLQTDGKIIVGGYTNNDNGQILIARYNSAGSLDNTFGSSGKVNILRADLTGTSLYSMNMTDIGIKSDGKIILCGYGYKSGATYEDFYIFQFLSSGELDITGFGTNGYTVTDVSGKTDYAFALEIQSDDKIIVSGYGDGNFVAVRYTSDGNLDTDFASSGIYTGSTGRAQCITILDDGTIFLGGESGHDFGIIKLDTDGTIDNLFALGGLLTIDFGGTSEICYALANDGTYVFAGGGAMAGWSLAKFAISNGSLDNSFNSNGKLTTKLSTGETADYVYTIECLSDGRVVASGRVSRKYDNFNNTVLDFGIARLNTDGSFDLNFNSNGKLQFNFNQYYGGNYIYSSYCRDMILEPGGDIILVGGGVPSSSYRDFCVAKVNNSIAPVPVELTNFSASKSSGAIQLNWQTAIEVNNYGFEIQKSEVSSQISEKDWKTIGFVEGHGNSNSPKEYSFIDQNLIGSEIQYRLKQIDTDGSYEYSNIITVVLDSPIEYKLSQNYPNPFNPNTVIEFAIPEKSNVSLTVFTSIGEEVAKLVNQEMAAGHHSVNFNASQLSSGIYFYRISAGTSAKGINSETGSATFTKTNKMLLIR